MPNDEPDRPRPTQRTPQGLEIPVPEREDVMRDFRKVFKPEGPAATKSVVGRLRLRFKNPLRTSKDR